MFHFNNLGLYLFIIFYLKRYKKVTNEHYFARMTNKPTSIKYRGATVIISQ